MLSLTKTRRLALALIGSLAVAHAASAEPSVQLESGATTVRLSRDLLTALQSLGVAPAAVSPGELEATETGASVIFPIPTGELDAAGPLLEIVHSGGLTLTAGDTRVALTTFIIENLGGSLQLTGVVKANDSIVGRIPLFDVALTLAPEVVLPSGNSSGRIKVKQAKLTLTATAADALNGAFGLDGVFTPGFRIGTAFITARIRDNDG